MPETKPSYADLAHQVVREATEPVPFAEIVQRVNALVPITTRDPKSTIRNAVSQSRLIVNTGEGRYGWKYRVINGSVLRLPLSESDLAQRQLTYTEELRDALWPAFFEIQKRADRSLARLQLPDGAVVELTLEHFAQAQWGTRGSPELWGWLESLKARPGDELIFRVVDGEARLYAVKFQPRAARDEQAIAARNQQVVQAALAYFRRTASSAAIWDISSHLLATGQYQHPVPPDPLEQIWTRDLWEPELNKKAVRGGWVYVGRQDIDRLLASLLEQIGEKPRRRASKKERTKTSRAKSEAPSSIYQIKVTLKDSPSIWRRIHAPGDISLSRLHAVLQIVMGWTNSHLHQFKAGGRYYGEPDPEFADVIEIIDERQVRLNQIAPDVEAGFVYEYDFGDSWEHELVVEKILPPEKGAPYPRCTDGKCACPPEDVGGVWGYQDFLEAMRDPNHPEHEDMVEWAGGEFDPEAFDLRGVNGALQLFQAYVEGASR